MKPSKKLIKALEKAGVGVSVGRDTTTISYHTRRGGEECEEIPRSEGVAEWLRRAYEDYDASYEAYLWLDNAGHGKDGAPYYMGDVLEDKEEWEKKLDELATIAERIKFNR